MIRQLQPWLLNRFLGPDLAILPTKAALLGRFSLVTIFVHQLLQEQPLPVRQTAWNTKALTMFADTLAFVRKQLWPITHAFMSPV